ncbi:Pikachurin, partial [Lucilia cuprina]
VCISHYCCCCRLFLGHCGHTSPCEQLCYEIHDGMYECDCIEGYELNKNGYSCQVINSSGSGDGHSKSDEDVLYQKGASFSAKLANNDNNDDNHLTSGYSSSSGLSSGTLSSSSSLSGESGEEVDMDDSNYLNDDLDTLSAQRQKLNSNDYYISNESSGGIDAGGGAGYEQSNNNNPDIIDQQHVVTMSTTKPLNLLLYRYRQRDQQESIAGISTATTTSSPSPAAIATATTSTTTTDVISNSNIDDLDDYYSKQDMSIYDDVNNNQLNLRPISHSTYQQQSQQQQQHQTTFKYNDQQHLVAQTNAVVRDQLQQQQKQQYHTNIILQTATSAQQLPLQQSNVNATTSGKNKISTNISYNISSSESNEICNLECGSDGICDNSEGSSRCLCPFGKTGNNCAEDIKVRVPKFSKHSWLAFPALRGAYKHVQLRIEFRPESFNGIILLSGERDDLTGDFMALLLNKGFVEFWFDCGSGAGSVRSRETILLNEWNSVIIYRHRWDAWLVLNHGTKVQGRSNGLFSRITFREPVFLGGTGNITGLANRLPITAGFLGCIRRFVANEHDYKFEEHPLGDVVKGFDIQDCVTDKCFKYPCQHGGKCLPSDQGAVCLCPIGFVGDLCEIRMDLQVPAFNGSSFLRYAPLGDSALIWLELKVILKPELSDGLILYSGPKRHGDFIALALSNGFVEFTFDLGSGPAVVRSQYPLSIGQWHTIKVSRTARLAVLKIDQMPEVMTISSNGFWHLSLPENLFVGGVNHVDKLPMDLKNKPFFMGCIQRIEINGHSLAIVSEALGGSNIGNCPHACVARPCGPLAECVPQMESYECRCSAYNAQCNKEAEVSIEELQKNKALAKSKQHGTHNDLNDRENYKQQLQQQQHRKGINHKKFKKQQQMLILVYVAQAAATT